MYEIYERYKTFRKIHFTWKKLGLSFGVALIISVGYLNYLLISDYNALRNNQRNVNAQGTFTISEDETTGKIIAESSNIKAVWHYKTLPEEYNNRGGGNIYELYDKRTDPEAKKNMAGVNNFGGGGTHSALTGIGGLGVTSIYDNLGNPSTGDNGAYATLTAKEVRTEGESVIANFTYIVKSNLLKDESGNFLNDYIVTKNWHIAGSAVTLNIKAQMLRNANISEPRISFNFNREYWNKAEIFGHDMLWPNQNCEGPNTNGIDNPKNSTTTWDLKDSAQDNKCYSTKHAEKLMLSGGKSSVTLMIDNGGKGFEGGGMFNYGYSIWGDYSNNMSTEFVLGICGRNNPDGGIPDGVPGAVDLHWFPWWGGDPPTETRYKDVKQGDLFINDTFKVEITAPSPAPPAVPPVQNPSATQNSQDILNSDKSSQTTQGPDKSSQNGETIDSRKQEDGNVLNKVADSMENILEKPTELIKEMSLWQKQILLAILLIAFIVEMIVIDKFTHVSKWLMYLYWHYIKRIY